MIATCSGVNPMSSIQSGEYIPKALHGILPKIPCITSNQKEGNANDFQDITFFALICLGGSTNAVEITKAYKTDMIPTTAKQILHPRMFPVILVSADAVETNAPKRAPNVATKAILPNMRPR
mmetsp:Transcript_34612/g.83755  ORF Transcript_34612/g.83755 Transcript_34612/m.83755 type:complete len:122 (+) Transcript_34612:1006-1371(+)